MKILICSTIYPGLGGIPTYFKEISRILKKRGHKITILAKSNLNSKKGILFVKSWNEKEITNKLKEVKNKFDIVIVGWYPYLLPVTKQFNNSIYIMPSIRTRSLKIAWKYDQTLSNRIKYFLIHLKEIKKEKRGMKNCKKLVYISKTLKRQAEEDYGIKKGIIIYPGVDTKKFDYNKDKTFDILIVSNLEPRKGIDKFLRVYTYLKSNPKAIILGEGDQRYYITKAI